MSINSINGNTLLTSGSFPPVRAASTGSPLTPTTGGLLVVDGITLVAGDRVLCKDESSAVNNGIYAASTGPWVRTNDAAGNQNFFSGMAVTVALGAVNAGLTYICTTTDDPVVIGTSLITFASQSTVATATQSATSTTSQTIGTGSKTFTIQAGKAFAVNQWVLIQETSNTANQMLGQITAYSGTSLTVNVTATGGSGTHADWTIVLTNSAAAAGFQPPVGTGNVTGPGSSTAGHIATFADSTGKVLSDGGVAFGGANTITPSMFANAAIGYAVGMLNGKIVTSEAGNALTIAVKTLAGADPSSSDPTWFFITDGAGGYTVIEQTAALSLVVPAGATLGTVNAQAGRQWIGVWNNSGAAVLGVYNSLIPTAGAQSILPWDETSASNGTGITAGSTSAQIWYTASTLNGVNFRVIGYVESKQTTAGQWAQTVTAKLFGLGVKKPNDTVQEVSKSVNSAGSTANATFVALTNQNIAITPQYAANLIRVEAAGTFVMPLANATTIAASLVLSRGTVANTNLIGNIDTCQEAAAAGVAIQLDVPAAMFAYDIPNVVTGTTYAVQGQTSAGTISFGTNGSQFAVREIQI